MESKYPNAEHDDVDPDSFKFIQPDGALRLCLEKLTRERMDC